MDPEWAIEREFRRSALRYSLLVRTVVLACAGLLAPLSGAENLSVTIAAVLAVNLWNLVLWWADGRWVLPVDLAVLTALCLLQGEIEPAAALDDGTSWVLVMVSVVAVSWQWRIPPAPGALVVVVLVLFVAYSGGVALVAEWDTGIPYGLWLFVEAGLARLLFVLVCRGARAADTATALAAEAARAAEVEAARNREHREYLATLHDTGAATLLMVGMGVATKPEPWLAEQAARDVAALATRPEPDHDPVHLATALTRAAEAAPVAVDLRFEYQPVVTADVADALARGVAEALRNVHRHAGVDRASLVVSGDGARVVVEVRDEGAGFAVEAVSAQRRGLTGSVVARMDRVGGRGSVRSAPGEGTTVRLEWPG
ncbi:ATP-binding protein [Crossiella sp. SN42]|uniref:sensor histidine kinase n=1 Tax=Crossiella sp. SN42 TaxID=2944808 RepID=UPI00207D2F5D|nr:ATP-binding protein [Crossiella sp. SN42]MCO1580617.1 ATP-binding protein [Crossiella sp. SN42]